MVEAVARSIAMLLMIAVTACAPRGMPAPVPTDATLDTSATAAPLATTLQFALIGDVTDANVWALFDSKGYSYNNYAVRSAYWPRLYGLSVPDGKFEPRAASGAPPAMAPEEALFTASVPLRTDLTWTDGSPFTADDVAFTVNTALSFQPGFDWQSFYDPAWLDHAEAVDAHTVKFFFKRAPSVNKWQYGALQGPVVQKKYWLPRIASASALLPSAGNASEISALAAKVDLIQTQVNAILASIPTAGAEEARQLQASLLRRQGDLTEAMNKLAKAQEDAQQAQDSGRQALYEVAAADEPTLGDWMPAGRENGAWTNRANPAHPFGTPHFEQAAYVSYADQASAVAALEKGEVDSILDPNGIAADAAARHAPEDRLIYNATPHAHFLLINPSRPEVADLALRRALFCAISRDSLSRPVGAMPLTAWIDPAKISWSDPEAKVTCPGGYDPLNGADDPSSGVSVLKAGGYTWTTEPSAGHAGSGLKRPDGRTFAPINLLAPTDQADPQSAAAALLVERSAAALGIPLHVESVDPADIRFAVFNSRDYDLALVGWQLSAYPGYLCDWFGAGNPFGFHDDRLASDCQALLTTSDLGDAQQRIFQIQSLLAQQLPFVPLYSGLTYDLTRGIGYPFEHDLGGLSALYGAPSLAYPVSH